MWCQGYFSKIALGTKLCVLSINKLLCKMSLSLISPTLCQEEILVIRILTNNDDEIAPFNLSLTADLTMFLVEHLLDEKFVGESSEIMSK